MKRILGIDPGFERLGIAVLEPITREEQVRKKHGHVVIFSECFKTSSKLEFPKRLCLIGEKIKKVIAEYKPEVLAVETLFLNTNQKTVMQVAEARGVVIYEAMESGLSIFEATPLQVKVATTGYGRASKEQVKKMVEILIEMDEGKSSKGRRASDDEIDAIAIALTAFAHIKN